MQHQADSRFHVESAWSSQAAIGDTARHIRQSAKRVDSIDMPQQQNWFAAALAGEIYLQMVAEVLAAMKF
jgi:hypothetical protein